MNKLVFVLILLAAISACNRKDRFVEGCMAGIRAVLEPSGYTVNEEAATKFCESKSKAEE